MSECMFDMYFQAMAIYGKVTDSNTHLQQKIPMIDTKSPLAELFSDEEAVPPQGPSQDKKNVSSNPTTVEVQWNVFLVLFINKFILTITGFLTFIKLILIKK